MTGTQAAPGTKPPGTSTEREAAAWVCGMFAGIAPKYDFLNHLLSFNIDKRWRKVLMQRLRPVLDRADALVLDLCCGTGDVLLDLRSAASAHIIGADFCHPMLVAAQKKIKNRDYAPLLVEGDALQLPIADNSLDAIAISFGFRNLSNYAAGLDELHRVLKPDGLVAILEFSHPPNPLMRAAYGFYSKVFMPVVGLTVSGVKDAYSYLPESIRKFPRAPALQQMMEESRFKNARFELLTGGIAALHLGEKT